MYGMEPRKQRRVDRRPFEKFAFISVQANESVNALTEKARKDVVRSHARRAALEREKSHTLSDDNTIITKPPVSLSGHISIFRVNRPIVKERRLLKARSGKRDASIRGNSISEETNEEIPTVKMSSQFTVKSRSREPLQILQDNGFIDPFDSLAISLGPKQRMLLHYCKYDSYLRSRAVTAVVLCYHSQIEEFVSYTIPDSTNLTKSFIAFDPYKEFLSQANSDPAWMNAAFCLVALHHDLRAGRGLSTECLHHRGEALRLVNAHLSVNTSQVINDSTLGAVASLVNFDITVGSTSNATMHMNGLQHMVMLQGGLKGLSHNPLLRNLIIWSDLLYSSACDSHPRFNFACNSSDASSTPVCDSDYLVYNEHLSHPPGFNAKMRETVRILRNLSLQRSTVSFSSNQHGSSSFINRL